MADQTIFNRCFIAYDGSQSSHQLLTVFKRLHPKLQSSAIAFVYDPIKNYIPYLAKGPAIQKQIKEKTSECENIDIMIVQKQQNSPKSTDQYILQRFLKTKSTFIMLGFYGSKGQKVRSLDLSSRVRSFVYDSKAIVAIVKNQDRKTGAVAFCCDGSEISYGGLKKAIIFCKKFGYNLTVLHTYNQDTKAYSKQVKSQLKVIQQHETNFKFETVIENVNLIQYLNSKALNFDWVIVTKNGYRGQITGKVFIGSNTTDILTNVKSNIFIL